MASDKVNSIIESVEGLNVLELVELKKTMEEKWGVTAAAPMAFAAPGVAAGGGDGAAGSGPGQGPNQFCFNLSAGGPEKIQGVNAPRRVTRPGLKRTQSLGACLPRPAQR